MLEAAECVKRREEHVVLKAASAIVLQNIPDTIVFGGAVRDWLLHKCGAKEYFKYVNDDDQDKTLDGPLPYSNPKFHPSSYKNRNTIPHDIDILSWTSQPASMIIKILSQKLALKCHKREDITTYIPKIPVSYTHLTLPTILPV